MGADEVLIFTRGQPAIRAQQLQYHAQRFFKRRAAIKPPAISDRIIAAWIEEPATNVQALDTSDTSGTTEPPRAVRFLKFATNQSPGSNGR